MASIRRFDVQARYSLWASLAAILPLVVSALASLSRYDTQLHAIKFGSTGLFKPAFFACLLVTGLLSVLGIGLGFNSAGQRRNNEQKKSWLGFFIGTGVLSLAIILFFAYWTLRLQIATGA